MIAIETSDLAGAVHVRDVTTLLVFAKARMTELLVVLGS